MTILWASIKLLFSNIYSFLRRTINGQSSVFYVSGRLLYDNDHEEVILRGINLMLADDWDFPPSDKLGELERTGANAVRIQWYANYPNPNRTRSYSISDLDAFLNKCRVNSLIPIIELHDWTGKDFTETVNGQMIDRLRLLINWWTDPTVVALLRRHERYLIINLANELGRYRFTANRPTALNNFKDAYKTAITSIRDQGLSMPIMIDAPDYGQTIDVFTSIGKELIDHDPRHSLLLSVHSYWAGTDFTNYESQIQAIIDANLPIVFGEIANLQSNPVQGTVLENGQPKLDQQGQQVIGTTENPCYYALDGSGNDLVNAGEVILPYNDPNTPQDDNLQIRVKSNVKPPSGFNYKGLLAFLRNNQIGWLAWAWHKDSCAARRMTPNGNYTRQADLTPYGNDIVFNFYYGFSSLFNRVRRTRSLPGAPPLFPGQPFPSPPPTP